jgi:hypothetical protein
MLSMMYSLELVRQPKLQSKGDTMELIPFGSIVHSITPKRVGMPKFEDLLAKGVQFTLGLLLTTIGWFIKVELTRVSDTLQAIQIDVGSLNRDVLLQKQKNDFEIKWITQEISQLKVEVREYKNGPRH